MQGFPQLKPLQELIIRGWDATAEDNRTALGNGWPIAEEFVRLHVRALTEISRAAGSNPSESDKAVILLGIHVFNLYISILGLTVRGLFDVASHLLRGLFDCQSLLYATAKDEQLAKRFAADKLKASDARKLMIDDLRRAGEAQLADDIERRFLDDSKGANWLAHVKLVHGDKLVDSGSGTITPTLGGRADNEQSLLLWKAASEQEFWALTWFLAFRKPLLDSSWIEEFEATKNRYDGWMKA